jgi:hypothetical protein
MKVKEALGKDGDRNDAAGQNWPHQQPTFLNVLNHAGFVALFGNCGKPATKGDLDGARPIVSFSRATLVKTTGR